MREDKFTYKSGEIEVELSQCWDCDNNEGVIECLAYDEKPKDYAYNNKKCPKYKSEG